MTDQFTSFTESNYENDVLDSAVLVEEGVVWHQEACEEQAAVNYGENIDVNLTDNGNESYITADEDDNTIQYLSVLESTNESILGGMGDISVTGAEQHIEEQNDEVFEMPEIDSAAIKVTDGGNPIVYRVEGSDDLYAIEVAYDEHGNIQRYQYKLRPNENGEYEGVPGTIEFLPMDDILNEPDEITPPEVPQPEENVDPADHPNNLKLYIKREYISSEHILPDLPNIQTEDSNDQLQVNEEDNTRLSFDEEPNIIENKADIIEHRLMQCAIHKQEVDNYESQDEMDNESSQFNDNNFDVHSDDDHVNVNVNGALNNEEVTPGLYESVYLEQEDERTNVEHVEDNVTYKQLLIDESELNADSRLHHDIPHDNEILEDQNMKKIYEPSIDSTESSLDNDHSHNPDELVARDGLDYSEENSSKSGSDTDDFHIVDGVNVTTEVEELQNNIPSIKMASHNSSTTADLKKKVPTQPHVLQMHQARNKNQNIINNIKIKKIIKSIGDSKSNKNFTYLIVQHPEKENVANVSRITTNKIAKSNPRSILKTSVASLQERQEKPSTEEKTDRRLIRNKGAMQAKQFQNFISKTTILQAPVRQERLPRKQTIKPVARSDEEIVVQEVVVSSNGFIETLEDGLLKSKTVLKPIDIVQLSDSDDDYDPKGESKRKKKHKKRRSKPTEIIISDSDDDIPKDVIHIDLCIDSDEENQNNDENKTPSDDNSKKEQPRRLRGRPRKSVVQSVEGNEQNTTSSDNLNTIVNEHGNTPRKRGRPPKASLNRVSENKSDDQEMLDNTNASKKLRKYSNEHGDKTVNYSVTTPTTSVHNSQSTTEHKCPKCTKSFPSQGSLRTHMQSHSFDESNSKPINTNDLGEAISKTLNNKHKCTICGETFKNSALLNKHFSAHKSSKNLECSICKKIFADTAQLSNHKRTHVKEQMFKSTTPSKISTLKIIKSPQKVHMWKCSYCPKIFNLQTALVNHAKTHNSYVCRTCKASFVSKLLLEDHIRLNCVKSARRSCSASRSNSFVASSSSRRLSSMSSLSTPCHSSTFKTKINCDKCSMTFTSHTNLLKHKVQQHGFDTPDKSLLNNSQKKPYIKPISDAGVGAPANAKLRNAFASLRKKLENY